MDEDDDKDDNKRRSRNLSEKKRRDQFNLLVGELSTMVSTTTRKMDKSTVLKSTISFLKNHAEVTIQARVNEIQEDWKPSFLSNEEFTHLILEALDGFIMVFSSSGRIFYASESITSLLGHLPSDLLNTSIYEMAFEEDRRNLYTLFHNPIMDIADSMQTTCDKENKVIFSCYLKRGCIDFREGPIYELVKFHGYFRNNVETQEIDNLSPNSQCADNINETDTRLIFVCTGRLRTPQLIREMSVVDSSKSEFTSRHSLEWKFLFLDHRAPPIIGYLPFEVLGTSGYDYYHFDDLEKVVTCHEALMQKGEGTSCYYRFLTKGQQWIWLQTRFYITYHQWNSKPEFVVCTHRVVSYVDVIRNIQRDPNSRDEEPCLNPLSESEKNKFMMMQSCNFSSNPSTTNSTGNSNNTSTGNKHDSGWSKSSAKASRYSVTPEPTVSKGNTSRYSHTLQSSRGGSDTASMSGGSVASRQSNVTHHSSNQIQERANRQFHYKRSRTRYNKMHLSHQQMSQAMAAHPSMLDQQPHYAEPPQFLAVPVQPVMGFQHVQAGASPSDMGILITPAQARMQEELQKKHEELQQMIIHQQEELRRVSDQLVMAKYGLLPPIINVSQPLITMPVPYNIIEDPNMSGSGMAEMFMPDQMPLQVQRPIIDHSLHQVHMHDPDNYIPMQMSQQQAQLLFSSPNHNNNNVNLGHPV